MENLPTGAVARKPAEEWFAAAGTFMGRVWSAVRAFRSALHPGPGGEPPDRPPSRRPASLLDGGELPESYGRTKVVAMAVNPYLIHVYWDVAAAQRDSLEPASLRFHEIATGNSFDVSVQLAASNWYVHLWSPDQRYEVELGVRRKDEFVPLARSNAVQTPRAWPVAEVKESYTRAPEPSPPIERLPEPPRPVEPSPETKPVPAPAPVFATAAAPTPPLATATPSPTPAAAPPARASDVLRERLSELYGFRRWAHRPRAVPQHLGSPTGPSTVQPEPDLTTRAETHFAPGVSSRHPRS